MTKEIKRKALELGAGTLIYAGAWILSYYGVTEGYYETAAFAAAYVVLTASTFWELLKSAAGFRFMNENLLMILGTAGAFYAGHSRAAAAIMIFFQIGKLTGEISLSRTRRSASEFQDFRPEHASLKTDEGETAVLPQELEVGQILILKPGERIPADGVVTGGSSMIDIKALTGESVPRSVRPGDFIYSGSMNLTSVLEAEVRKTYQDSTASRIMQFVEETDEKKTGAFVRASRFSAFYTLAAILAALLTALVPPLITGGEGAEWLNRGIIILVAACPCGLMVSVPLAFLAGTGAASRQGVLIRGGRCMEDLTKADTFVFDKTGTLTEGGFRVTKIIPAGVPEEELLELAAAAECCSGHPIGQSLYEAWGHKIDPGRVSHVKIYPGCGLRAVVDGRRVYLGNERLMEMKQFAYEPADEPGTAVYVTADGKYGGCIILSDIIRPGAKKLMKWLRRKDLAAVMMTGDNDRIAERVARELGIDSVFSEMMPEDKVEQVKSFMESETEGEKVAYVGDGVNDAPVLALADVGIAMGGLGSDAALEAADIILMEDEPSKIISAVKISGAVMRSVRQNMIFAVGVKVIMAVLAFFGLLSIRNAILADMAVMLINILNSFWITRYPE